MRVVLDTDRFSLLRGDSLEALRSFADKSFDAAIFDPPYSSHVHAKFGKERRKDGVVVPDALTFPPMTEGLMMQVCDRLARVVKGWVLIFGDERVSSKWGQCMEAVGGAWVRTGVWVKTNPKPQMTGDRPGSGIELITICHVEPKGFEWNGGGHAATWRGRRDETFEISGACWGGGEQTVSHPNQKPAWLMQALVGMFCPPGGLVLDPYLGSGSTAIGALATERLPGESPLETTCPKCAKKIIEQYAPPLPQNVSVVGVEGDPKYVDLAIARIRAQCPALLAA